MEVWAQIEDKECPCKGKGWALQGETWEDCPIHFYGQLHPQSRDLLLDDPYLLKEEERKSHLRWRIAARNKEITELKTRAVKLESEVRQLEHELINRTATIRMAAVHPEMLSLDSNWDISE